MTSNPVHAPSRRTVLGGGSVAAIAGALAVAGGGRAVASGSGAAGSPGDRTQLGTPVISTIASPAISGYTYRHVSWLDFFPESGPGQRAWGGYGAYSSGSASTMWATVEIPAGALVRDIEWYVRNVSAGNAYGLGRLWAAGFGTLFSTLVDTTAAVDTTLLARRSVVPSTNYGPHPLGTRINLGISTPTDGSIQVNGARIGFSQGAGTTGMLPTPVRVYDSRVTGGLLATYGTRTVTLPSSAVSPGTSAVVVNITAVGATSDGFLKVYAGNAAAPATSVLNYQGDGSAVSNGATVAVSSSRQLKVYAHRAVHFIVDVVGVVG